ncbi:MAG: FHA domain-containing protein [Desulfobacterales bacterium]|nr:FHA domain-containing protein [Desulfobacterales bacterium]
MLKSYKELPIVIGKKADADFVLNHAAIVDTHAQIFFSQNQYWIRDLTGRNLITVNSMPIGFEAPLKAQDIISLAPHGPALRFLGEGRLAEYEQAPAEEAPQPAEARKTRTCEKASEIHLRYLQEIDPCPLAVHEDALAVDLHVVVGLEVHVPELGRDVLDARLGGEVARRRRCARHPRW